MTESEPFDWIPGCNSLPSILHGTHWYALGSQWTRCITVQKEIFNRLKKKNSVSAQNSATRNQRPCFLCLKVICFNILSLIKMLVKTLIWNLEALRWIPVTIPSSLYRTRQWGNLRAAGEHYQDNSSQVTSWMKLCTPELHKQEMTISNLCSHAGYNMSPL